MDLFRRRPLFCACTLYLAMAALGFLLYAAGVWTFSAVLFLSLILLAPGLALALSRMWRRHYAHGAAILLCVLLPLIAVWQSYATLEGGRTVTYLRAIEGSEATVEGRVTERRGSGGYMTTYALSFSSVNGQAMEGDAILICDYISDLQPGDAVTLQATVLSLADAAGNTYDENYLLGNGFLVGFESLAEDGVTLRNVEATWEEQLSLSLGTLRRSLAARLDLLAGHEGRGLPSALLLGETGSLDEAIRRDFSRTGTSHILSISGLHMVLLFGLLERILRSLRVRRRSRAILLGVSALGYLSLIGFPPSATRAVIMLGITYLSTLTSSRVDALTSLGLSGVIILMASPAAVASAGFWMSFLATLGLVTFVPLMKQWAYAIGGRQSAKSNSCLGRVWHFTTKRVKSLLLGIAVGLVAMSFTLFLVAAVIGEFGVLSPVATLLLTPPTAVILLTSLVAILPGFPFLGALAGKILALMGNLMATLTSALAEPSGVVISLRHPAVLPLAALMLGLTILLLGVPLPRRRRWTVLLPMLVCWSLIGGIIAVDDFARADETQMAFLQPSSQSDELILVSNHKAVICDLSNGSLTAISGATREAHRLGATEISVLMLTHYHSRTAGTLSSVLNREKVRALWLPTPQNETENDYYLAYAEKAEAAGVPITLYDPGDISVTPNGTTLFLETTYIDRSVQPVLLLTLDTVPSLDGVGEVTICGSAVFESDLKDRAAVLTSTSEVVIFGNHGPLPKQPFGTDLTFTSHRPLTVILSGEGDIATYFDAQCLPVDTRLHTGEWHWTQRRQ